MKILLVNKFYYPKDGVSNYVLALEAELKKEGHDVRIFAMDSPKNIESTDQKYFVSFLSFDKKGIINTWRSLARIFYSFESKYKFKLLVDDFRPDIIHIHNIYHQISPSILSVAKVKNIPVVMHLHDYKLICPNYKLFINNKICEKCRGGRYYNCLMNKCVKESYLKSLGATLEMYFHHKIWPIYKTSISNFIAPSHFMKNICENFGWPASRIIYLPNFFQKTITETSDSHGQSDKDYLLYFGRLAPEKGVSVILSALQSSSETLKIVGEGPELNNLIKLTESLNLTNRVKFIGFKSGSELLDLIKNSKAVIIPSIWYENMPLNMIESLALGKVVIASNIGGMPEVINDAENGFLFKAGSSLDLALKINDLPKFDLEKISIKARESVKNLNLNDHVRAILEIYNQAIKDKAI